MEKINIDKLNISDCWEGYIWMSNSQNPLVNEHIPRTIDLNPDVNPFIVEGELFDNSSKTSYSIKYIDGEYHVYYEPVIDEKWLKLKNQEETEYDDVEFVVRRTDYLSNRMDGKWLKFLRFWEPTEEGDENCEGMKPLIITKNVFIGFKNVEKKKED